MAEEDRQVADNFENLLEDDDDMESNVNSDNEGANNSLLENLNQGSQLNSQSVTAANFV